MLLSFPREMIHWSPVVNTDMCAGDRICYDFCRNEVFAWDARRRRPVVLHPMKCAVGCDACARLCPSHAIEFPGKEALGHELNRFLHRRRETIRKTG